jgi:hypothetical protein
MTEDIERAQEHLEHEAEHGGHPPHARRGAILVAALAAVLAITETSAKKAQTDYLSLQIAVSDTWSQYQGKSSRRVTYAGNADLLSGVADILDRSAPGVGSGLRAKAAAAGAESKRMKSDEKTEGMDQLQKKAEGMVAERDRQRERTEGMELAGSGLQLAILLASVSVVFGIPLITLVSAILGGVAALYGLLAGLSIV